jgi:hypothetical protein
MTFYSQHRPPERYSRALEQAGMVIEAIREHRVPDHVAEKPAARRWQRLPLFMHIRAFKIAISCPASKGQLRTKSKRAFYV